MLQATLYIFVHSKKYLIANEIKHPSNLEFIDVKIEKILKNSHFKSEYRVFRDISIPEYGDGHYIELDVTKLVTEWFSSHEDNHTIIVKILSPHNGDQLTHKIISLSVDDAVKVSKFFIAKYYVNEAINSVEALIHNHFNL